MTALEAIDTLPRTRRGWIAAGVIVLLFVFALVFVNRFYNVEGGMTVTGGAGPTLEGGLIVQLQPVSIDATRNVSRMHFAFQQRGSGLVDDSERLTSNLRVTVTTGLGLSEYKFPAGTVLGQAEAEIALDGEEANYPFDRHAGFVFVAADTYQKQSDSSIVSTGSIPVGLGASGGVNGWDSTLNLSPGMSTTGRADVTYDRAFSTQVFALLILMVATVLALLALIIGLLVNAGRRPAEAALLSWSAALLFALPALRSYLPNGPPIGASIDIYVYLWCMVAAGLASVLLIIGWSAQRVEAAAHRSR